MTLELYSQLNRDDSRRVLEKDAICYVSPQTRYGRYEKVSIPRTILQTVSTQTVRDCRFSP